MDKEQIIKRLIEVARQGQEEINNGDWERWQLPDKVFSGIVPENLEGEVLEIMVESYEWLRGDAGFIHLPTLRDTDRLHKS